MTAGAFLQAALQGKKRLFVCGLALDFCVTDTCLNAKDAGFDSVHLLLDAARADLTKQQRLAATLQEQLDAATATAAGGEGDAAARSAAEEATAAARERERLALAEAERLRKSGAQDLRKRRADCLVLKESANRWTDNLFELRKQLVERGFDPKDADKALGTGNLDFID